MIRRNKIYIAMFFLIMANLPINAFDEWHSVLPLRGKWKFTIGDNLKWASPEFNDSDWEEIRVPSSWEDEGFYGYNGYAWYRVKFDFHEPGSNRIFYISLGYIDDADEVYLNGKLIGATGSFPPNYSTAYNALRRYPIPKETLNLDGTNVLAVRVYDSQLAGGIVSGDVGIFVKYYEMSVDINLEGEWQFHAGDIKHGSKGKSLDDEVTRSVGKMSAKIDEKAETTNAVPENWQTISVPGFWEPQGYRDYDGFAWYRKSFTLPEKYSNKKLVLVLGKIDDIDEAYINGQLIGSTGQMYDDPFFISHNSGEYQQFRGYYIPDGLLIPGKENLVEVRVYDGFKDGGIYEGPIGLVTQEHYRKFWRDQKKKNIWELLFGDD